MKLKFLLARGFLVVAGCGQTTGKSTDSAPFPASSGVAPEKLTITTTSGDKFVGTASVMVIQNPNQSMAHLYVLAQSVEEPSRRWSAQFAMVPADFASGNVVVKLRPGAQGPNEGFVDDASGPAPLFSLSGSAKVHLMSQHRIALEVDSDTDKLSGVADGSYSLGCASLINPNGPDPNGNDPGQPSAGATYVYQDVDFVTSFCGQFKHLR